MKRQRNYGNDTRKTFTAKRKVDGQQKNQQSTKYQLIKLRHQLRTIAPPVKSCYYAGGTSVGSGFLTDGPAYPALGGAANERLGAKIQLKSLNLRFKVTTSNTDTYDSIRITVVQYKDSNATGSAPANSIDNVFDPLATASYPWLAPFNSVKTCCYHVLFDELIHVNEQGMAEVSRNLTFLPKDLSITKLDFVDDGGGQLPGLEEGLIRALIVSDSTAIPNPSYEMVWRLNYTDT